MWAKVIITLVINVAAVYCLPGGAPTSACTSMTPSHGSNSAQANTNSPYAVSVSSTNITSGELVTVTLTSATNAQFRGILLQARETVSGDAIGSWALPDGNYQNLECFGDASSALTHTSRSDKNSGVTFQWTSPSTNAPSSVQVFATVVQVYATFYVMLPTEAVSINAAPVQETTTPEVVPPTTSEAGPTTPEANVGDTTTTPALTTTTPAMTTTSSADMVKMSFSLLIGALLFRHLVAVFSQ